MTDEMRATWGQLLDETFALLRGLIARDLREAKERSERVRLLIQHLEENDHG